MVEAWMPVVFTPSLSGTEDFVTDGDKLLEIVDLVWVSPEQGDFVLDPWQRWLIRHVLERYPDDWPVVRKRGRLRYKQVVISMARQNGKSVLGAVFGLYALLFDQGPEVISVASSKEQAEIIYKRVRHVIENYPGLARKFKTTGTRGIASRNPKRPASYVVKASAEETLQGVTISKCLYDEIHITKPETWGAVVFGISARQDAMVLGITTAGDNKSVLLKSLYKQGHEAAAMEDDYDETFGFFLWEAPAGCEVDDPDAIMAANPSIACGRRDLDEMVRMLRSKPEFEARRYGLNQFVATENSWMPTSLWTQAPKGVLPDLKADLVFAVERTLNWDAATITASQKVDGRIYTEVVASIPNPNVDMLEKYSMDINKKHRGALWVMDADVLKDLAMRLRERGVKVEYFTTGQMKNVCATAYAVIAERRVTHAHDPVTLMQWSKAVAKNSGDGWKISRRDSAGDVDGVIATVMGIYGAESMKTTVKSGIFLGSST